MQKTSQRLRDRADQTEKKHTFTHSIASITKQKGTKMIIEFYNDFSSGCNK